MLLADDEVELTFESKGCASPEPVRARRAVARERLSSYREPASFHPQAVNTETDLVPGFTRTVSPSLHPRLASGDATDFLLASALSFHQQPLRAPGGEDARCVQPTSATHTICVHPHLARSRLALATFAAGSPHGVLGSVRHSGDLDVSRRPWSLRRIVQHSRNSSSTASRPGVTSVGVFFPRRCCDRASDTPVAIPRFTLRLIRFRGCCVFAVRSSFGRYVRVGAWERPPRPPWPPPRERRRFVMIRDAFYRQEPFVESGGRYSPGSATASPPFGRQGNR